MLRRTLSIATLLLLSIVLFAQDEYQALEWGVVSSDDLAMTTYSHDSTAQAVVLADEGFATVVYGQGMRYQYVLHRHRQVKILHEAAAEDYGDATIYFYHKDNKENIRNLEAQTIAPDGTTMKVEASEIYWEKINEYWSKMTFSFPNVSVGSILEYRYVHNSQRVMIPDEWTFRESIPVRSSFYRFDCIVPLNYTYFLLGVNFMTKEELEDGRSRLSYGDTEIIVSGPSFWMKNGTAVKIEPFMTTPEDYYIKALFQASESISFSGATTSFYSTWEEACSDLLELDDLGGAYTKKRHYRKLLAAAEEAITPGATQEETVYQISQFITEQIKWSGRRGFRTDMTVDDAFARHEADLAEIQYAGLALLREYGMDAHPVLLSTRDNGAMIKAFPFLDQFNYVILLVEVDGRQKLMDFSDPLLKPGVVQMQALNSHGFLLNEEKPVWIDLNLPVMKDILVWKGEIKVDGSISGEMTCTMSAFSARSERAAMEEEELEEIWSDRLPEGGTFAALKAQNVDDVRKAIKVEGAFEVPDAGFANDDFLYVNPTIYASLNENPFTLEKRDYPIDFPYPFEEKSIYTYDMPEGYAVESLPEQTSVNLPNGAATLNYLCKERDGQIKIIIQFRVQKTLFPPEEYPALRDLFEELENKMQEQIVLRKTETSN
ncbi:MAG: DUF3857 domain-containing protein [Bacteroidota bacterium]